MYHDDDKTGASYAAVLFEKGFDNIYLVEGGIENFYQKKPELVKGSELPVLQSEIGRTTLLEKMKMMIAEQKPKFRKTKEELIKENQMMFMKKPGQPYARGASHGLLSTAGNQFQKPNLQLDPKNIKVNKKFDDIPSEVSRPNIKAPSKPKTSSTAVRRESKAEKPLTDKLTNIAVDGKTMTSTNVERRIDRLHTSPKELTQKPNFGKYQPENHAPY